MRVAKTSTRRVGRPRTRSEDRPGDYVGFRAPRELKERLERTARLNGRSISAEAQIRLEKTFDKQDLLSEALELAYGPRLTGILLLISEVMAEVGGIAGWMSGGSPGAMHNWTDDPFAYDQAVTAVSTILHSLRPTGDPNVLQNGKSKSEDEAPLPWTRAIDVLTVLKNPKVPVLEQISARVLLDSLVSGAIRYEQGDYIRRALGPLVERISFTAKDTNHA